MKKSYSNAVNYLLLLLLFLPLASRAQFTPIPGHVYAIIGRVTGNCMEVGGSNRYAPNHCINGWGYWGGSNQQWEFRDAGNGQYKIQNRNSRQFLNAISSTPNAPQKNSAFQAFENNGGGTGDYKQRWSLITSSTGGYKIRNTNSLGFDEQILTEAAIVCDGGDYGYHYLSGGFDKTYQDFNFVDVSASTPGVFRIMNAYSGKALSASEDNSVTQLPMWYLASQEWTFSDKNSTGYISIINRNTNQVLEIGGGNWGQPGARANVWDGYGNDWQQWRLVSTDGNNTPLSVEDIFTTGITCKLINRYSGLALEIGGGGDLTRDGLAANQWYDYNGLNQQWHIYIDSNYRSAAPAVGTAVSVPASNKLTLYPNPASTTLQLTLPGNGEALQVTITDARGYTGPVSHQHGKVDVSNLASGLYIISASDGQKTFRQKFIKE